VVVACAGIGGVVPALARTDSGGSVRVGVTAARGTSAGPRLDVDAGDELRAVAGAGTSGVVAVSAGTEPSNSSRSVLRTGVETSAGRRVDVVSRAGTDGVVPVLGGTESGGSVCGGVSAALCPAAGAGLRVDADAEAELTVVACAATGGVVPEPSVHSIDGAIDMVGAGSGSGGI
jgi:hypothetical protein